MEPEDADFLSGCAIIAPDSLAGKLALAVRDILFEFGGDRRVPRSKHEVSPAHRVQTDLDLHHLDSLNLSDVALELEQHGRVFSPEDWWRFTKLNQDDATVATIITALIDFSET